MRLETYKYVSLQLGDLGFVSLLHVYLVSTQARLDSI